jgi:hypothetical protein
MYELREGTWVEMELYPEQAEYLLPDQRTGGLLLITNPNLGLDRFLWERRGSSWSKIENMPAGIRPQGFGYRASDGMLMVFGATDKVGKVALFRDRTSPTPLETCEVGTDADGDGLAFCDDPDCYWRCSRCPPYTTCRFDLSP